MSNEDNYIPAMGYFSLARFYDPLMRLFMREKKFKSQLIQYANISPNSSVLDLGCGTGTLLSMIKLAYPQARVVGLDGDEKILHIARQKFDHASLDISLDLAMSFATPYPDGDFDRVLNSLMLHHLSDEDKYRTLIEVFRILAPGGEVHIADFATPHGQSGHLTSHLHGLTGSSSDGDQGLLPHMLTAANFISVRYLGNIRTIFGTISYFSAVKPV